MSNNINVSKEVNLGRGPVDFKFSNGYTKRVLIEVKLARNSKFWNGLNKQLPAYMKAEEINRGYFLVICHKATEIKNKSFAIYQEIRTVSKKTGFSLGAEVVDATRNKPSASKL